MTRVAAVVLLGLALVAGAAAAAGHPAAKANGLIAYEARGPNGPGDFVNDNDIYVVAPDGTGRRNLTPGPDKDSTPVWSPDGTKIAFERVASTTPGESDSQQSEIYVMGADGSGLVNLTNSPAGEEVSPNWSPDGARIAFAVLNPKPSLDHAADLFVMNADGSERRALTTGATLDGPFSWSPNSRRIVFTATGDHLRTIGSDGTGQRLVRTPGPASSPVWSPNGARIAFQAFPGYGRSSIWTASPTGAAPKRVTRPGSEGDDMFPSWSPDGARIAFTHVTDDGTGGALVVSARGGTRHPLARGFAEGSDGPTWSPDGRRIVFVGVAKSSGARDLYVANPDGSRRRQLTRAAHAGYATSWQARSG